MEIPGDPEHRMTVYRWGDLMGDVYFQCTFTKDAVLPDADRLYAMLDQVNWTIGGRTIESFTGQSLEMSRRFHGPSKVKPFVTELGGGTKRVTFPLRLCTDPASGVYIPLVCIQFCEIHVTVRLTPEWMRHKVQNDASYIIHYMCMSTLERRALARLAAKKYPVSSKSGFRVLHERGRMASFSLELLPHKKHIRDIILQVRPLRGEGEEEEEEEEREPVEKIELYSINRDANTHGAIFSSSGVRANQLLPRMLYGVETDHRCYVLPFDPSPVSSSTAKGWIDLDCETVSKAHLQIFFSSEKRYVIDVLVRNMSTATVSSGMVSIGDT